MPTYKINITLARELSIAAQSHRRSPTKELEDILETFFEANAVTKVAPKSPYTNAATQTNVVSEVSKRHDPFTRPDLTDAQYDAWKAIGKPQFDFAQWEAFIEEQS